MDKHLKSFSNELDPIDFQRKMWLILSSIVVGVVLYVIFHINQLTENGFLWPVSIIALTISVAWWYWTMKTIRILINQRKIEIQLLSEIQENVKKLAKDIQSLH